MFDIGFLDFLKTWSLQIIKIPILGKIQTKNY